MLHSHLIFRFKTKIFQGIICAVDCHDFHNVLMITIIHAHW